MSDELEKAREAFAEAVEPSKVPHTGDFIADRAIDLVRAIIADPIPKDGETEDCPECGNDWASTRRLLSENRIAKTRIADLERERDEARGAANHNAMLYGQSKISAARLRKAVEDVRDVAVKNGVPGTDKEWALRYVARRLTAALQPEPGTDPQPARGEDSPVSAHTCYECDTPLMGPYCPKCDPPSPSPDLVKVREALERIRTLTAKPSNVDRIDREAEAALASLKETNNV